MIDLFVQAGLSNACLALPLAIVAMVVGAKTKRPHLAHLLWLIVLVKLVTPPIVTIPIDTFQVTLDNRLAITGAQPDQSVVASSLWSRIETAWNHGRPWLASVWLLGSVVVLAWSLLRVFRFNLLLLANSERAPQDLQTEAERIANRLELTTIDESGSWSPARYWTKWRQRNGDGFWLTSWLMSVAETIWSDGSSGWLASVSGGIQWYGGRDTTCGPTKKYAVMLWSSAVWNPNAIPMLLHFWQQSSVLLARTFAFRPWQVRSIVAGFLKEDSE